ncbi:MAG: hypothetical protein IT342_23260 [Candidatus Melainabacteria bacterium]|nr:hypothetical protein [Candidatus Melainabacteria bacterium]
MSKKASPLDASSELFASLHSALAVLEAAIAQQASATSDARQHSERVNRVVHEVDPTSWTSKIEAARSNADELARLRVLYDEKAIGFISTFLSWDIQRGVMMDSRSQVSDAIIDALIAHDDIAKGSPDEWLKPIFKARINFATSVHASEVGGWPDLRLNDGLMARLQKIQVAAFKAFVAQLPGLSRHRLYSCDPVVHGRKYEPHLNNDVDLRNAYPVPFVDCVNSTHPASEFLAALYEECHNALSECWLAEKSLKEDNGRVNERQHANRLLDYLHSDDTAMAAYRCGGNLDQQVEAQNNRRYAFETCRHVLMVAVRRYKALVEKVVETLKASAEETAQLISEMEAEPHNTIDRIETAAIMINNCLATDARLRFWMRHLSALEKTLQSDLSRGAGSVAITAAFEDARKNYDWQVTRKREALAGKTTEGGGE